MSQTQLVSYGGALYKVLESKQGFGNAASWLRIVRYKSQAPIWIEADKCQFIGREPLTAEAERLGCEVCGHLPTLRTVYSMRLCAKCCELPKDQLVTNNEPLPQAD